MEKFLILEAKANFIERTGKLKLLPDGPEIFAFWVDTDAVFEDFDWKTNQVGDIMKGHLDFHSTIEIHEELESSISLGFQQKYNSDHCSRGDSYDIRLNATCMIKKIDEEEGESYCFLPPFKSLLRLDNFTDIEVYLGEVISIKSGFAFFNVEPYATREEIEKDPRLLDPTYDKVSGKYIKEASQSKNESWTLETPEE